MRGLVLAAALFLVAHAAVVEYDWEVTYVTGAPDGFERKIIGINGAWPCPTIEATKGDVVVVHMKNSLDDETTGIHFHGINQIGTPWQDGAIGVSQCGVPPGSNITYAFVVDEPGTYWYHSHDATQYPDGLRGPMIVHDPYDPWEGQYEEEFVVTLSDWYHDRSINLVRGMLRPNNTLHQPPLLLDGPDSMLVNDGGDVDVNVEVGKTYRFRFINVAAIAAYFVYFHNFDVRVIMTDGSYVKEEHVSQLRIGMGQRYDMLVTIEERHKDYNWPFLVAQDFHKNYRIDSNPPGIWPDMFNKYNVSGYMMVDPDLPRHPQVGLAKLEPFNEADFRPLDDQPAWGPVTKEWVLDFTPAFDSPHGNPIMPFNGKAYVAQRVPTLYTAGSTGAANTNASIYGQVNPFIASIGDVVQIIINNNDTGIHPYHLHGHQFQIVDLPGWKAGFWDRDSSNVTAAPPRRDTVNVEPNSHAVLRVRVTHPGVFLLHCHIDWHMPMGLIATLIQGPDFLRGINIPQDHLDACEAAGMPTRGNAAGNPDPFNMTGFRTVHDVPYIGSTWVRPGSASSNTTAAPNPSFNSRVVKRKI